MVEAVGSDRRVGAVAREDDDRVILGERIECPAAVGLSPGKDRDVQVVDGDETIGHTGSGGFLGLGNKISGEEENVLAEMQKAFGD